MTAADQLGELDYVQWSADVLASLGLTAAGNNMTAMVAWCLAEGGHNHNSASWNPLGTTITAEKAGLPPEAVVRVINSHGVKAYRSRSDGLAATVATMRLPRYTAVVYQLRENADPVAVSAAVAASGWGTGPGIVANISRARGMVQAAPNVKSTAGLLGLGAGAKNAAGDIHIPGTGVDIPTPGADAVPGLSQLKALADFTQLLLEPGTWLRLTMVGAGAGLVVIGAVLIASDLPAVRNAAGTALATTTKGI